MGGAWSGTARTMAAGVACALALALLGSVPAHGDDPPAACAYGAGHPAPVRVSDLPGTVVADRTETVRIRPRGTGATLADTHLSALTLSFEQIDDGEVTFTADLLHAYRRAHPGQNIGYDVHLGEDSPGERAVVRWTDDDPALPGHPCAGEARTTDMRVVARRSARRPRVSARSGASDVRHGDSAVLAIGGTATGCPLTDPSPLTAVARSAGITRRFHLDMACGAWSGPATVRVDRFTILPEDGAYLGASRLYVSPRAAPTPGAQLTLEVYKGKRRIARMAFHARDGRDGRPQVVRD